MGKEPMTPYAAAMAVPSENGFATDVFAHFQPGGVILHAPAFFLLARPVELPKWFRFAVRVAQRGGSVPLPLSDGMVTLMEKLTNPFTRFENPNAWCLGLVTGDAVAAYQSLIHAAGELPFVCWQNQRGHVKCRKAGQSFSTYLSHVRNKTRPRFEIDKVRPGDAAGSQVSSGFPR
jgi:hypothetical protein